MLVSLASNLSAPRSSTRRTVSRCVGRSNALRVFALVGATWVAAACGSDGVLNSTPQPPKGIIVMDGFIQPGLTFLADTGSATTRTIFGPTTEFDAGGFTLLRDTVLAVSSRAAGDLLYIADVRTGTMRKLQLPAKSNPSRARLLSGTNGAATIGVALRDSGMIATITVAGSGAPTITRLSNAGLCPTDLFVYDNATWAVDANATCRTNYTVQGDVRLIRIPNSGTTRDTVVIPGMRGSGASAIVANDVAYVSAGGDASFTSFPYTLISSGSVAKVDLKSKRVLLQRAMPTGTYGGGVKLGLDGYLYVSLYQDLAGFKNRVMKLRADDLSFVSGVPATATSSFATPWLTLTSTTGTDVTCGSAQADALGRIHCIVNGTGSATSLVVFDATGKEVRRVSAGQGGVDLALR